MQKETYDRVKSAFVDRLHLMKQTTRTMTPNRARMTARATRPFFLVLEVEDLMLGSEDPSIDWVGGGLVGISFQESKAEPFLGTSAAAMVTVAVDRVVEAEGVGVVVEETWVGGWAVEVSLVTLSSSASKSAIAVSRFSVVSRTSAAVVTVELGTGRAVVEVEGEVEVEVVGASSARTRPRWPRWQLSSSAPLSQSGVPSHTQDTGTHAPSPQWNEESSAAHVE